MNLKKNNYSDNELLLGKYMQRKVIYIIIICVKLFKIIVED